MDKRHHREFAYGRMKGTVWSAMEVRCKRLEGPCTFISRWHLPSTDSEILSSAQLLKVQEPCSRLHLATLEVAKIGNLYLTNLGCKISFWHAFFSAFEITPWSNTDVLRRKPCWMQQNTKLMYVLPLPKAGSLWRFPHLRKSRNIQMLLPHVASSYVLTVCAWLLLATADNVKGY